MFVLLLLPITPVLGELCDLGACATEIECRVQTTEPLPKAAGGENLAGGDDTHHFCKLAWCAMPPKGEHRPQCEDHCSVDIIESADHGSGTTSSNRSTHHAVRPTTHSPSDSDLHGTGHGAPNTHAATQRTVTLETVTASLAECCVQVRDDFPLSMQRSLPAQPTNNSQPTGNSVAITVSSAAMPSATLLDVRRSAPPLGDRRQTTPLYTRHSSLLI